MRLALETGAPIVPVAVIGAEEQAPAVNFKPLAKLFGMPVVPGRAVSAVRRAAAAAGEVPALLRRADALHRRSRRRRRRLDEKVKTGASTGSSR